MPTGKREAHMAGANHINGRQLREETREEMKPDQVGPVMDGGLQWVSFEAPPTCPESITCVGEDRCPRRSESFPERRPGETCKRP
jgi:hypothetical protein